MDLWDSLSSFLSSDALAGAVNAGAGAYDMYQGFENMEMQRGLYDQSRAAMEQQMALSRMSQSDYEKYYRPLEVARAEQSMADFEATRGLRDAQRAYAIERGLYDVDRARDFYQPLEESVVEQLAEGVDPQEFMDIAATDVQRSFDRARQQTARQASRYGVNPADASFQNTLARTGAGQALAESAARTTARRTAEDMDLSKKAQALNYYKGIALPTTQSSPSAIMQSGLAGLSGVAGQASSLGARVGTQAQDQLSGAQYAFSNVADYWGKK